MGVRRRDVTPLRLDILLHPGVSSLYAESVLPHLVRRICSDHCASRPMLVVLAEIDDLANPELSEKVG